MNDGKDFPKEYLRGIFDRIKDKEFENAFITPQRPESRGHTVKETGLVFTSVFRAAEPETATVTIY